MSTQANQVLSVMGPEVTDARRPYRAIIQLVAALEAEGVSLSGPAFDSVNSYVRDVCGDHVADAMSHELNSIKERMSR